MRLSTLQNKKAQKAKDAMRKSIARQLREAIEKSELKQEELAHRSYISPSVLSRAAAGKHNLTMDTLGLICHGLGVEITIE